MKLLACFSCVLLQILLVTQLTWGQVLFNTNSPCSRAASSLKSMIESKGKEPLIKFIEEKIAPVMIESSTPTELVEMLGEIRRDFSLSTFENTMPKGPYTAIMTFAPMVPSLPSRLMFEISAKHPHRFVYLGY